VRITAQPATGLAQSAEGKQMAARNHIGFIVEPETSVFLQHPVGGFEVATVAHHLRQPDILDLRDIDRRIPGGE
jgi:hypothetical protein